MSVRARRLLAELVAAAALLFATLHPFCAYADDTSEGAMLPGLRSDPPRSVTVSSVSLIVRDGRVEAKLAVDVPPAGSWVTIQMPRFGWLGESEPYPDRHFPELKILNGKEPTIVESSFVAFMGSTDVTKAVLAAGVDPFAIANTPPFVTPGPGSTDAFEMLQRLGAVELSGAEYIARWTAQRAVKVRLTPGSTTLALVYRARPAYSLRRFDQISRPAFLESSCLSVEAFVSALGPAPAGRLFAIREYAISVSIDDKPPHSLSIAVDAPEKKDAQRSLLAFCGADKKAVTGREAIAKVAARTDAKGVAHIFSIETALR